MGALDTARRALDELGFFSKALEEAKGTPMKKGTVQQWRNVLTKQGVKQSELNATGFNDIFAADPNRAMSKDEVVRFLTDRRVKLGEASSGGAELNDLTRRIDQLKDAADDFAYRGYHEQAANARDELYDLQSLLEQTGTRYHEYALPGGDNYMERRFTLQNPRPPEDRAYRFQSSHWDEPDIVYHARQSDRVGPNGERVLHLDEIQSDWAQQGRERGFAETVPYDVVAKANEHAKNVLQARADYYNEAIPRSGLPSPHEFWTDLEARRLPEGPRQRAIQDYYTSIDAALRDDPEWARHNDAFHASRSALDDALARYDAGRAGLNPGPFVTNTNDWVDLALKKAMIDAERGGYDAIAWTPGAEQAKRYNLADRIDNIQYLPDDRELRVYGTNGGMAHRGTYAPEDLPGVIGKDNAKRLLETEPRPGMPLSLQPEDMVWGGEGMSTFYDKMVAERARKLARTLDPSKADAVELAGLPVSAGDNTVNLHTLRLTPAMKDQIRQGLPLFVGAPAVAGGALNALRSDEPPTEFRHGGLAQAAQKLAQHGRRGDTMLAHINPREAAMLKAAGGSGTINPKTGLPEFWGDPNGAGANAAGEAAGSSGGGWDINLPSDQAWADLTNELNSNWGYDAGSDSFTPDSPYAGTDAGVSGLGSIGLGSIGLGYGMADPLSVSVPSSLGYDMLSATPVSQQDVNLTAATATPGDFALNTLATDMGPLGSMATMPGAVSPMDSQFSGMSSDPRSQRTSDVEFNAPGLSDGIIAGSGPGAALAPGDSLPSSLGIMDGLRSAAQAVTDYFSSPAEMPAERPSHLTEKTFDDRLPTGDPRVNNPEQLASNAVGTYAGLPGFTGMGYMAPGTVSATDIASPVGRQDVAGLFGPAPAAISTPAPTEYATTPAPTQVASLGVPADVPVPGPRPSEEEIYGTPAQEKGLLASISDKVNSLKPDWWSPSAGLQPTWTKDPVTGYYYDKETGNRVPDPTVAGYGGATLLGMLAPPLGAASMVSGLLGGPTLSGVLGTMSGRNADTASIGYGGTGQSAAANNLAYGPAPSGPTSTLASLTGDPTADLGTTLSPSYAGRSYLGAASDPTRYGYQPERVYFT